MARRLAEVPRWVIDVLIIQSSFFISYRLFMAFEKENHLMVFRREKALQPLLIYIGGPVVLFFELVRFYRKGAFEAERARSEAAEGQAAEEQYVKYGSTNLPLLTELGWSALAKRVIAGLQAQDAVRATFIKLNLYYLCYFVLVLVLLFVAYQFGNLNHR